MKPDIVVCNPRDVLYPLFMARINKDRDLFNKVIVVMTQQSEDFNFTNHIKDTIKDATVIEKFEDDGGDWRNSAINEALKFSDGDSVLFLEQDFLVTDGFFAKLVDGNLGNEIRVFKEGDRVHPACFLISRELLDKTSKNFSVEKDIGDHFYKFVKELQSMPEIIETNIKYFCVVYPHFHINGLTQNYRLLENWYQCSTFKAYNLLSIKMKQHSVWRGLCIKLDAILDAKPDETMNKYFDGFI